MKLEEFYLYQEKLFDAFSKLIIKRAAMDIHGAKKRRAEHERQLTDLDAEQALYHDTYQLDQTTIFEVRGHTVLVQDPVLGRAIFSLHPNRREVILLFYFTDLTEVQIGKLLNISAGAVNYRRSVALSHLRKELEAIERHT